MENICQAGILVDSCTHAIQECKSPPSQRPPAPQWITVAHQRLVLNLLSDEFVLAEGVARLSSDGVYGPLLHLLFDGAEQHEERLTSALLLFWKASQGLERKVGEKGNETRGWKWRGRQENCFHQRRRRGPVCRAMTRSIAFLFLLHEPATLRKPLGHTQGRSYVVANRGCGRSVAIGGRV